MPVTYAGMTRQFVLDWKAATVGRGDWENPGQRPVAWYANASAATRALRRLLANLELLEVNRASEASERLEREELSDEARRLIAAVPAAGTRDQRAIEALWTACDVMIEQLEEHARRELKPEPEPVVDPLLAPTRSADREGYLYEAASEFRLGFRSRKD